MAGMSGQAIGMAGTIIGLAALAAWLDSPIVAIRPPERSLQAGDHRL
jgi:hypothetical protein